MSTGYFGPTNYTSPGMDNLWAGTQVAPVVADDIQLAQDATNKVLLRGTVLGRVDATGLFKVVDKTATDGSENVWAILAEDRDVSAGPSRAPGYLTGEFSETGVIFVVDDVDDHRVSARERGIFFKSNVPVGPA